jgi:hypothetical protein
MRVGFSGTRNGMRPQQLSTFLKVIEQLNPTDFIHGACKGADEEAAKLVRESIFGCRIIARPGKSAKGGENGLASTAALEVSHEVMPAETHFVRNRKIVADCDVLIATPFAMARLTFGGTEYTIAQGKKAGKRVLIIQPDGSFCPTGDQLKEKQ